MAKVAARMPTTTLQVFASLAFLPKIHLFSDAQEVLPSVHQYHLHPFDPYNHGHFLVACLPMVDKKCQQVFRSVTLVKEAERCFEIPRVECDEESTKSSRKLCSTEYEMDRQMTTATVTRIRRDSECTRMKSDNYKATFCYYLPRIDRREVGATLVFPSLTSDHCSDMKIENPSNNCRLKMTQTCVMEPVVTQETQSFIECKIDQKEEMCTEIHS